MKRDMNETRMQQQNQSPDLDPVFKPILKRGPILDKQYAGDIPQLPKDTPMADSTNTPPLHASCALDDILSLPKSEDVSYMLRNNRLTS